MPATRAKGGFGTRIYRDDGSGTYPMVVAELKDISGPDWTLQMEDATNQDSPNGWVEKIGVGLKESGDVTFQMNFLDSDASQLALRADLKASAVRQWRIVFPGAAKRLSFSGTVSKIGATHPVRGIMVSDVVITTTGEPILENHP